MWSVWKYSCKSLSWSTGERWTIVLESTMVYMGNSEYVWNGDLLPTRCRPRRMPSTSYVTQNNCENSRDSSHWPMTVKSWPHSPLTLASSSLWSMLSNPRKGKITFCTDIRVVHLILKNWQGKNHRMVTIDFVGSPGEDKEKDLGKLGNTSYRKS